MSGKGSKPRPIEDYEQFSSNWDAIFKKKKPQEDNAAEHKDDEQREENHSS